MVIVFGTVHKVRLTHFIFGGQKTLELLLFGVFVQEFLDFLFDLLDWVNRATEYLLLRDF